MSTLGFEPDITELRLGLPGGMMRYNEKQKTKKKRVFSEVEKGNVGSTTKSVTVVVGWPPLCSHRMKSMGSEQDCIVPSKRLVKISMDGVPFLRKVDINGFNVYLHFVASLEELFGCSGLKNLSIKHTTQEALEDNTENCDYVLIYEDMDGDWLLVGDVPWRRRQDLKMVREKSEGVIIGGARDDSSMQESNDEGRHILVETTLYIWL